MLGCALMLVALGLALTVDRSTADHKHICLALSCLFF